MTEKIIKKQKEKAIYLFEKTPIVGFVCQKIDISRSTFYRWQKEDPKFKELSQKAILNGKFEINDFAESQLVSLIKEKNISAIIYWLKNNNPNYSEKNRIIKIVYDQLSPEQGEIIKQAISQNKNYETRKKLTKHNK